jgi:hypothetical protein
MIQGKTVCVVAQQAAPPEFIAAMADRDTERCKPRAERAQQALHHRPVAVIAPPAPPQGNSD